MALRDRAGNRPAVGPAIRESGEFAFSLRVVLKLLPHVVEDLDGRLARNRPGARSEQSGGSREPQASGDTDK